LFDTVRIWEFSPVWTDFDKFDNLSKRNVKLILKVFSDLEPLGGSSNKKKRCIQLVLVQFGPFLALVAHSCQKKPKPHTNSLNKLLFLNFGISFQKNGENALEFAFNRCTVLSTVNSWFISWNHQMVTLVPNGLMRGLNTIFFPTGTTLLKKVKKDGYIRD
jgi:hypothetical protein